MQSDEAGTQASGDRGLQRSHAEYRTLERDWLALFDRWRVGLKTLFDFQRKDPESAEGRGEARQLANLTLGLCVPEIRYPGPLNLVFQFSMTLRLFANSGNLGRLQEARELINEVQGVLLDLRQKITLRIEESRPLCDKAEDEKKITLRIEESRPLCDKAEDENRDVPRHADDFTWVIWFGTRYDFKKGNRAGVVGTLWESWERAGCKDGCGLAQETIAEKIGTSSANFRVDTTFRGHPAWGKMIRRTEAGTYALYGPEVSSE